MKDVKTIVFVMKKYAGQHRVVYADGSSDRVSATALKEAMTTAGIYCLNVWPAPLRGLGVDS